MATGMKTDLLTYEQLLEMISAFQWIPEQKRLRFVLDLERDNGPGNPIYGCFHHFAPAIERMERRGSLTCHEINLFLVELALRYELVQRIDAESVVTEVNRLVQTIGVDLVMIGVGNAYVTGLVLVMRRVASMEWNRFCDYADKQKWKVNLSQVGAQSHTVMSTAGACAALCSEALSTNDMMIEHVTLTEQPAPQGRGLAQVFENKEFNDYADSILNGCRDNVQDGEQVEDDQEISSGSDPIRRAENDTGSKSHGWSFKKYGLR